MTMIDEQNERECLLSVYDEILEKVDKYLPLFDGNKFRENCTQLEKNLFHYPLMMKLCSEKILRGLHANSEMPSLKKT